MKPTLLETRQRANELLSEAIDIWRQSEHAESLEGIEKDPVFSMIMTVLAYQANEYDSEFERIRQNILEDFAAMLTPFEVGHAIPASTVISTQPLSSISSVNIDENTVFRLKEEYNFMPLFKSKVVNTKVESVERLDGRRWLVKFEWPSAVNDLGGFSFALNNEDFRNLSLYHKSDKLRLIRPWNYSELPFIKYFDITSLTFNHGQYYSPSMLALDLFVKQNIRYFQIEKDDSSYIVNNDQYLELIFEFHGIDDKFVLDDSKIFLNPIILVNSTIREVSLSASNPIARLSGYTSVDGQKDATSQQFLHLVKPSSNLLYSTTELEVRKVNGDRFNQGSLVKLLNSILNKYHTDFYAYQNLEEMKSDRMMLNLQDLLNRLIKISQKDYLKNATGVYLLLHDRSKMKDPNFSLNVKYLTTSGAGVNGILKKDSTFNTPVNLDYSLTKQISLPQPGIDEVSSQSLTKSLLRYYMLTSDRLVTPSDLKLFCITELQKIYSIGEENIDSIKVSRRQSKDNSGPGYEICVEVSLKANGIVKRTLEGKIPSMELLLQKMMEVRSAGVYPIRVNIMMNEDNN